MAAIHGSFYAQNNKAAKGGAPRRLLQRLLPCVLCAERPATVVTLCLTRRIKQDVASFSETRVQTRIPQIECTEA